ncbi:hypothetical protein B296_00023677 [Ensete ventricosum]|uniref:Uncharacterized protein n=1 Tax=Ensete ventricosum TaxID=4639 RepID=A0A427AW50_ENSVE|nr:hypothetical protein B296_00023677 [Ensete ventricosum]
MSPPPSQINTSVSAQTMVSGRDTIPVYRSMSMVRQGVHKYTSVDRSLVRPSPEEHDNDVGVKKDEAMNKASETCQQGQQQAGGFMQQVLHSSLLSTVLSPLLTLSSLEWSPDRGSDEELGTRRC